MAFDEHLAQRVESVLKEKKVRFEAKRMFGGIAYMVDNKMCVGIIKNDLMARIDPAIYDEALTKKGCIPMEFTGKPMVGYVNIRPEGVDMQNDLEYWISLCLEFNPRAKSSKK
ncbi:MAG: TfoX/Sxy family protein [Flavobacteriales bacterium]